MLRRKSAWDCTLENLKSAFRAALRIKGLRCGSGVTAFSRARAQPPLPILTIWRGAFHSLRKDEMTKLAAAGALNPLQGHASPRCLVEGHARRPARRSAARRKCPEVQPCFTAAEPMTIEERLTADYGGTGVNIGRHPMAHRRQAMDALWASPPPPICRACAPAATVRVAGCVIVRQRPGTAKGIVFLSLEDETGIANVVVMSEMFDENRLMVIANPWLLVEGPVQNVDNVIHVRAKHIEALPYTAIRAASHDFH